MRLIVITQRVDEDDPALGATVPKLRALAGEVDELVVLALAAAPTELPKNVRVKEFGAPTQALRGARLLVALVPELATRQRVAVLAHMAPIYAVIAAPIARVRRAPVLLWFTHWRASRTLRWAERLATRVVSVDRRSFPLQSSKLVPVGHGVDVDAIRAVQRTDDGVLRLLALGRTSPAKGLETIAAAARSISDIHLELEIRGPSLTAEERRHRDELVGRGIVVAGPVPHAEVPAVLERTDILVNNMRAGTLDKVVFEAAAAGLPVLVASEGFGDLIAGIEPSLCFAQDDPASLAEAIRALAALGVAGRARIGAELRLRVLRDHSTAHWAKAIVAVASR